MNCKSSRGQALRSRRGAVPIGRQRFRCSVRPFIKRLLQCTHSVYIHRRARETVCPIDGFVRRDRSGLGSLADPGDGESSHGAFPRDGAAFSGRVPVLRALLVCAV
ncbi:hypothetical protein MRX96_003784 [Rhipicephalus microplus]